MKKFGFILVLFLSITVLGCTGCRSNGQQPSNPFAMNRQTAPPPSTFSSQAAYLGQTPSVYVPQAPATVYPGTAAPSSNPVSNPIGAPLPNSPASLSAPSNATPGGSLGAVQPSGAILHQMAAIPKAVSAAPVEKTASSWTAVESEWNGQDMVPVRETLQTAFQDIESKTHTISTVSADGTQTATVMPPEKFAVSSSQVGTKIIVD